MAEKFDYIESQADADELIAEFGQIGAIPRTTLSEGPNPWKPGGEVTSHHQVTVVLLPINLQDAGRDVGGTLIKSGDQQALISPKDLEITPTTTDVLLVNGVFDGLEYVSGEAWTAVSAKTRAPAGVPVLHDLIIRR